MTEKTVSELEREVEAARARDLTTLRSPAAYQDLKQDLKQEAQSVLQRTVSDLTARAAANPGATLAIGAGIAWRLMKHPPIATALIGAGLFSLWRTAPISAEEGGEEIDYLSEASQRLKQQVNDLAGNVKEYAAETAGVVKEEVGELAETAKGKLQQWGAEAASELESQAASLAHQASQTFDGARQAAARAPARAAKTVHRASSIAHEALSDENVRDRFLLGAAGLAVAAALGIAYQRRSTGDLSQF